MLQQYNDKQLAPKPTAKDHIKAIFRLNELQYNKLVYEIGLLFIDSNSLDLSQKTLEMFRISSEFWKEFKWRFEEMNDWFVKDITERELFKEDTKTLFAYYKHFQLNFSSAIGWLDTDSIITAFLQDVKINEASNKKSKKTNK